MKLTDFRQTPFVTAENFNKAYFEFDEFEEGAKVEVLGMKINAEKPKFSALIPCVSAETLTPVTLHLKDGSFVSYTYKIKPVEKSEVCVLNICGGGEPFDDYCTLSSDKTDADRTKKIFSEIPSFRYASSNAAEISEKYIKSGQFEPLPDISALCTSAAPGEDIAEKLTAARSFKTAPQTAFIGKASGLSLGAVTYFCGAGIKYAIILPNKFRNSDTRFAAELFMLKCGSKSITVYIAAQNGSIIPDHPKNPIAVSPSSELVEHKLFLKTAELARFEDDICRLLKNKKTASVICTGEPNLFLSALCDEMSSKWKYPVFSMETPSEFMKKIIESAHGNIPEVSGEISCPCGDDASAYGIYGAEKRKFSYELQTANAFSLIKALENPSNEYCKADFEKTASELSAFYVQNIDFSAKNPIEMHCFNMFSSKFKPLADARKFSESVFSKFIDRKADGFVTAINQTLRERKFSLISPVPLDRVVCQKTDEGYLTEPVSLPPFGAKSFVRSEYKEGAPFAAVFGETIDTGHYRISFDLKNGKIKSIVEISAMRELLDLNSDYALGDMIYAAGSGDSIDLNLQKCIDFHIENGPLAVKIIRRGIEEQSRAEIVCTVTLYKHSKNIDLNLEFSNAASLSGDYYDRYEKNIFFALPLRCEDYRFISTHQTGELCEASDRLPIGVGDFAVCRRYAAVENDYCGTMVVCRETPIFHFGKIQYGSFSPQPACTSAHMYLYAASNRANQLVYKSAADCRGEFNLSILPYRTNSQFEKAAAADAFLHPPKVVDGYSVQRSRISVSEDGIEFGCFRHIGSGAFLLRLCETAGISRRLTISVPFKISKAFTADLFGNPIGEISDFSENTLTVRADSSAPLTLLLCPARNCIINEKKPEGIKFYSYTAHCGRITAVWDKFGDNLKDKYEIFCDGEKIAEVKAQSSQTQIYMTKITGNHKIEVK